MLRAGFARLDISPAKDVSLLGYDFRQSQLPPGNDGIHDPLHVRVLVLHDGTSPAAIVSLDICILLPPIARHLREQVARKLNTTTDRVLLSCTHTHSGPFPLRPEDGKDHGFLTKFIDTRVSEDRLNPDAAYAAFLEAQLLDATARAAGLLVPVRVESQQAACGLAYTRRHRLGDGRVKLVWNPQEAANLETAGQTADTSSATPRTSPLQPSADPLLTVLQLRQVNGPRRFVVWSVGAHPTVMGKTSRLVSADWPGKACETIDEESYVHSLFLLGPCGDTHAWVATQESFDGVDKVAATASSLVNLLTQATEPADGAVVKVAAQTLVVGKTEVDISAWRVGDTFIASAPVEMFAELGAELRRRFPKHHLVIATNTQGWTGYWPTEAAFAEGDYEINAAKGMNREPGDGEKLIDALTELLKTVV